MTDEQFDQLVTRIQRRYGSRPLWLRARTAWLVAIGYAGFLAGLLLVLLVSAGLVIAAVVAGTEPSGLFGGSNAVRDRVLVTALMSSVQLPGRMLIVAPQGGFRALAQKIMVRESSPIFP